MAREVNVYTSKPVVATDKDKGATYEMEVRYDWTPDTAKTKADNRTATVKAKFPDVLKLMPAEYVEALAMQVLLDYARLMAGVDAEVKA